MGSEPMKKKLQGSAAKSLRTQRPNRCAGRTAAMTSAKMASTPNTCAEGTKTPTEQRRDSFKDASEGISSDNDENSNPKLFTTNQIRANPVPN